MFKSLKLLKEKAVGFVNDFSASMLSAYGKSYYNDAILNTKIVSMLVNSEERSESYRKATLVFAKLVLPSIKDEQGATEAIRSIKQWEKDANEIEALLDKSENPAKLTAESILDIKLDGDFSSIWKFGDLNDYNEWIASTEVPDFNQPID